MFSGKFSAVILKCRWSSSEKYVWNGLYSVGTYFYVLAFFKNFAGGFIAVSDIFRLTHAACPVELRHI